MCAAFCSWTTRQKRAGESLGALFSLALRRVRSRRAEEFTSGHFLCRTGNCSLSIIYCAADGASQRRRNAFAFPHNRADRRTSRVAYQTRISPLPSSFQKTLINLDGETSFEGKNSLSQILIYRHRGRESRREATAVIRVNCTTGSPVCTRRSPFLFPLRLDRRGRRDVETHDDARKGVK